MFEQIICLRLRADFWKVSASKATEPLSWSVSVNHKIYKITKIHFLKQKNFVCGSRFSCFKSFKRELSKIKKI